MHRMHSSASISERKFAEKLTILLERGQGILTRVYNIKKVSARATPWILNELDQSESEYRLIPSRCRV